MRLFEKYEFNKEESMMYDSPAAKGENLPGSTDFDTQILYA